MLLASALRARGVQVRVAALYAGGPREQELASAGVPVWLGGVPRKWQVWRLLAALWRLFRLMRRERPDVVHAFLFHAYVIAGPLARLARVPVTVAGRRSLGSFLDGRPLLRLLGRWSNHAYDAVVANAQAVADDTLRREGLAPAAVHVIPNALPDEAFATGATAHRWAEPVQLLCVGNLIAYKGHSNLLAALAQLRSPVHLDIAGEGPERDRLQLAAEQRGLDVSLLGARRDVAVLLQSADVFVLPSLEEGMSNALMEAMAAGLPIVATDVGGNREVLGDTGVLCRAGDPADLARTLQGLLDDPEGARAMGCTARRRAEERFRVDAFAEAHVTLYRRLLEA
ncbi:MAG: hypothetical protein QOI82_1666 [Actinomycetota bacterium]|nr:hypothetical protein [Actinomycetota bacterium]